MDSALRTLLASGDVAIIALLLGNIAQAAFILLMRRDRERERDMHRAERTDAARQSTAALERLAEVITQLRVVIAQCGLRSRD